MEALAVVLLVALVVAAVVLVLRALVRRVTVFEYERGLRYDRGRFSGLLEPGQYWILRSHTLVEKVDVRPVFVSVPGQEVLSADGVALRTSLAAEYRVSDPALAAHEIDDHRAALYVTLQLALREIVGSAPIDELLENRAALGSKLLEIAAPRTPAFGVELRSVDLKDIMFPGDLKRTFAQVVVARKEGLAALERARGETAALRNLANAARLVEGNPSLLQLRLLQQLASSAGNTIVLGLPSSSTPLPLREPGERPPPAIEPERE